MSADQTRPAPAAERLAAAGKPGMLTGLRVIEVADETAEYVGLVLAGLGAEVIKIEPPGGSPTRAIGPFIGDQAGPGRSLHFLNYNRGKRSVVLDPQRPADRTQLLGLIDSADVLVDGSNGRLAAALSPGQPLAERYRRLVVARMTPFGDTGPWKDFQASDLIHLALGGVMMNCGYDADPAGRYDTPPIAPQMWHAYHIAGDQLIAAIVAALLHRARTGEGQDLCCAVHEAVAKNTEIDVMSWVMRRAPVFRQTARHAVEVPSRSPNVSHTKDGRWVMTWGVSARDQAKLVPFLERWDMAADLEQPAVGADFKARTIPGAAGTNEPTMHTLDVVQRFMRAWRHDSVPWQAAQEAGLLWAPVRKPHENAGDEHWRQRGTFADIEQPGLGLRLRYPVSRWLSTATAWQAGGPAPQPGEHQNLLDELRERPGAAKRSEDSHTGISVAASGGDQPTESFAAPPSARPSHAPTSSGRDSRPAPLLSVHGLPFALQGVRILDFSWFLASAGGTRILAALGAESLKVEWKENPDTRLAAMAPVGGRAARERATAPLPGVTDSDMGGQFNNKNSGKRGLSLNIRHPKGLAIAKELVRQCDIVAEGFSPGVLERLGLGYDVMRSIRPDIIYVQQSGMGTVGHYGRFRTVGPIAASLSGATDMSGLPEPAMPAGWGYSYLDWIGAYGFALAALGALWHRERTGEGQWIDSSQCEAGIFQTGVAVLDWSANGRVWRRTGNRSPFKPAAPHGAYRCRGDDRWIAIACFDEAHWRALVGASGLVALAYDPRFANLSARLANQDALDAAIESWTTQLDDYECMLRLQSAGVPAGVCQSAADRCDRDPQLRSLNWLSEVTGTKIGRWPVGEFPVKLSRTPAWSGGPTNRGAPCYGEDNEAILSGYLGMSQAEIARLAEEGVI